MTAAAAEKESVFRPAAVLMCGRMLAFAATFYIPVVLARVFGPAQFGTYKQLFLIQSTVFYVGQMGMATSLYYFLPRTPERAGRYLANSLLVLGGAGLCGMGLLAGGAPQMAAWMKNGELSQYMVWMGLYLLLMMLAAPLEMLLIARHRHVFASASYALSDLARAAGLIAPALLFRNLDAVVKGAVVVAAARALVALFWFGREFPGTLRPDRELLKKQLGYALPFGVAVLIEVLQGNLPAYVVSYLTNPAAFAIFAVGCLQIPLVDFAASPTSDVMMVQMQEKIAQGRRAAVLGIWHDTTWKLALFFFPLAAMVMTVAPETIVLLFTRKYLASVPIFIAWTALIPLAAFQVDGVLRVFAQTRLILILNLVRLAIIAGLLKWSLGAFQLVGPALVIALAMAVFKAAALIRIRELLEVKMRDLLPWGRLGGLVLAAAGAAGATWVIKSHLALPGLAVIATACAVYAATFGVLVWNFRLLSDAEIGALQRMLARGRMLAAQWQPSIRESRP